MDDRAKKASAGEFGGTSEEAPGSRTRSFFADVVSGTRDVPQFDLFEPTIQFADLSACASVFEEICIGHFDRHIYCSIPTYYEMQRAVACAVSASYSGLNSASLLDLGASEGALCKAISYLSQGQIRTVALDPNLKMQEAFLATKPIQGASFLRMAISDMDDNLLTPPFTGNGEVVPYYDFSDEFDVVIEHMLFQFLSPSRNVFLRRVKSILSEDGVFICCEKLSSHDDQYYLDNEEYKGIFKSKYFYPENIKKKYLELLASGSTMAVNQMPYEEFEDLLRDSFSFCFCFWDAGNLKGTWPQKAVKLSRGLSKVCRT